MAQLKDLIVNGASRLIGDAFVNKIQITSISAPTSAGGSTYGPGTSGQVLKSNGTSVYWGTDSNSVTGVKGNSESSYRTGNVNITAANLGLGNVENTKLSTWAGSANITTIGTLSSGTVPWARLSGVPAGASKEGTVTSITPGNGLLNGTGTTAITNSGTLNLNYGTSATAIGTASAGSANTVSRSDHVHSINLATGDNNGQVKIAGTNVSVKGLGSNAYTSTAYAKRAHSVYYVLGSSSGSAGDWTGTIDSEVTELYDGLTIIFCPQKAGVSNSTNRTLTNDDSTTVSLRHTCLKILGVWKPVYYQQYNASNQTDNRLTTHYGANAMILMTYRTAANGGNGGWVAGADYNSDAPNYRQLDLYFRPYASTDAIYRYKICALDKDNRLVPLTTTNQTNGTNVDKTQTALAFKPDQFWFYNTTTTTSAGTVTPAQVLYRMYGDWSSPQYTFNTTIPAYTLTYLKGSFNTTTGLFTLDQTTHTSWQVNVPTNTANLTLTNYFTNGSYYILMGGTYSTANYFCFFENNPMFYFDGTNLVQVYHTAIKATQDGSGNNIVNTYLTKAAGVTNVAWDSTNKKLTKTINGTTSDVVTISTIKTALSLVKGDVGLGNVENKSSATIRGELTSSNVTTALGFTPYNATNPNGYTTNTGTVTKVIAGTGLSIGSTSGGNFTTSGTINHTNSVTAQTTQALYPIKIDAQGHISAYGSAVTIPNPVQVVRLI